MKTIFITGASSGIGKATVELLQDRFKMVICGRNQAALTAIKNNAPYPENIHIANFDVAQKEAVFMAIDNLPSAFSTIDILINNAGNAHGLATFDEADLNDLEAMIDINVKGVIYVTKAVLPLMPLHKESMIINISSIAGKQTYMNGTTYCASKFAVEAFTQGLRIDLAIKGIRVASIAPGAVATNFSNVRFKGDMEKATKVYEGFCPLQAVDIANSIQFMIDQPAHVQIADITILPASQASASYIVKAI